MWRSARASARSGRAQPLASLERHFTVYAVHAEVVRSANGETSSAREAYKKPELLATGSNQLLSWAITALLGLQKWREHHLRVIPGIFSRHPVGWWVAAMGAAVRAPGRAS